MSRNFIVRRQQMSNGVNIAIILAAGESMRMGGKINKVFLKITGKPLIYWTIKAFEKHKLISGIILVAKKRDFDQMTKIVKKYRFSRVISVVEGGKMRQDSAYQGLKAIENLDSAEIVLFHNGVNPLVSSAEITRVIVAAKKYSTALVAQPVRDTVKQINNGLFVKKTLDRRKLWLAQTPQAIKYELAKTAFKKAKKQGFYGTDDVSLVERLGKRVKIVPASWQNIKVTTKEDLNFVKNWVKNNRKL